LLNGNWLDSVPLNEVLYYMYMKDLSRPPIAWVVWATSLWPVIYFAFNSCTWKRNVQEM